MDRQFRKIRISTARRMTGRSHGPAEPGSRIGPQAFGGARGDVQGVGGLDRSQAGEVAEFHQFRGTWVLDGQSVEGLVQRQQFVGGNGARDVRIV
jgi:hypothetical protein